MLQIFLQPSKITASDWQYAYNNIKSIVEHFPTKIIRTESHMDYGYKLSKLHFDLVLEAGTPNEHVSFRGDWMSYTLGRNIRFYKDWSKQQELQSYGKEADESKPITWYADTPYSNDGSIPNSNGILPFSRPLVETGGAYYEDALIAIGAMLEDLFPEAAFLTFLGESNIDIDPIVGWLEAHFDKSFNKPLYFDKLRLLKSLRKGYDQDEEVICRLAHLYRQKHLNNMTFAIEHIGYEPAFEFYAEVLSQDNFGTFGFESVLDPWIAASQDLSSTLNLIAASKKRLSQDPENERNREEIQKYDLGYILKKLLNNYIHWTPVQREQLEHFHTNKHELEGGQDDLFGVMNRMMGLRVDICPIYADKDELFEAFMYHDPKNGKVYKKIIDDWVERSAGKYEELKHEIDKARERHEQEASPPDEAAYAEKASKETLASNFVESFLPHERYFVVKAITRNPLFLDIDGAVNTFKERVIKGIGQITDKEFLAEVKNFSKEYRHKFMRTRIKEVGYQLHPNFKEWFEAVEDNNILFHLHFCMALKVYDQNSHFSRFRLLWDNKYWKDWEL